MTMFYMVIFLIKFEKKQFEEFIYSILLYYVFPFVFLSKRIQ